MNIFFINPPLRPSKEGNNGIHFSGFQFFIFITIMLALNNYVFNFFKVILNRFNSNAGQVV